PGVFFFSQAVAVSADDSLIWVVVSAAGLSDAYMVKIDAASMAILATYNLHTGTIEADIPHSMVWSLDNRYLYILVNEINSGTDQGIIIFDTITHTVVHTIIHSINVGQATNYSYLSASNILYVTNTGSSTLSLFDMTSFTWVQDISLDVSFTQGGYHIIHDADNL